MIVKSKATPERYSRRVTFKGEWSEFCCHEMDDNWGSIVKFGEHDSSYNENNNVNIFDCSPYPEGASWSMIAISFCPWCGEEILIDES